MPKTTRSSEETEVFASGIAASLEGGDIIALTGDLGAGKTHFARGLAGGLGVPPEVPISSPTFSIVQEYSGGRLPLYHFDFYRLESSHDLLDLGWDEYLDAGAIIVVEWADKFPELLPAHTRWWLLSHNSDGSRAITEKISQ